MTEIILARHGETDWNVKEVFRGRANILLEETGLNQAEALAQYLQETDIDVIYSSPLSRAFQTAEAIAQYHPIQVLTAPPLIDIDYGEWQGLSPSQVKDRYKSLYDRWLKRPRWVKFPGGESLRDVKKRAMRMVNQMVKAHSGTVVLVSHRVVNKVLMCAMLGLDNSHFWNIRQDIGAITTFHYENQRFVLVEHNNTSYLPLSLRSQPVDF